MPCFAIRQIAQVFCSTYCSCCGIEAGTQTIDRAWRFIRDHMIGRAGKPGSARAEQRIRSAQWCYWNRETDKWARTGEMLSALREM
eukprot:71710-Alexandrium_andersonii.AAC.1